MKYDLNGQVEENGNSANKINMETRTIIICDMIDENFTKQIVDCIGELDANFDSPIHVKINSLGGNLFDAQSIVTTLLGCRNKILVDIIGVAFSSAALIALCGTHTRMSKLGLFMLHYPEWTVDSQDLKDQTINVKFLEEYFRRMMKTLLSKTRISYEDFVRKVNEGDMYLTPSKCLRLKVVNEIY
jgi:ATP-dependent Clp protease protease subunit